MNTLVVFYSFSGHTRAFAQTQAREGSDLLELRPVKPVGKLRAYTAGCFATLKGAAWEVRPIETDLAAYERFVVCSPIWAGGVPPYVNSLLEMLPAGKTVRFKLISGSGQSKCRERLESKLAERGCKLMDVEDIKG